MNQVPEYQLLQDLCVPTMLEVLQEYLVPDNSDIFSMNPSLNLSEGQLVDFAIDVLTSDLQYDIENLAKNDPAAGKTANKEKYVWDSYKGLKAVMYYRIANHLLDFETNCLMQTSIGAFSTEEDDTIIKDFMRLQARKISERAAEETTIEINPSAIIGKGFVIDHGIGTKVAPGEPKFSTVVGETCIIGDNCTLLNSVLLGAAVINEASSGAEGVATGKRHPTLGNNVTVCAGVRILGNIKIGDNVTIGPCSVITTDIPSNYNVTIVNQLQYTRPIVKTKLVKPSIHGLTYREGSFWLFGENLYFCNLSVITFSEGHETLVSELDLSVDSTQNDLIIFNIKKCNEIPDDVILSLRVSNDVFEYILSNPQILNNVVSKMSIQEG